MTKIFDFLNLVNGEQPPTTLFHYTSQDGLLGIINSDSLWATDINYLNDEKEFINGKLLIEDEIRNSTFNFGSISVGKNSESILDMILKVFKPENLMLQNFVCSFSKNKDQLSQWRAYCPNSIGFSIGFNTKKLLESGKANRGMLLKCCYSEKEQRKIVKNVIEDWIGSGGEKILSKKEPMSENDELTQVTNLFLGLFRIAPITKHSSFHEEEEWRMVFISGENLNFRTGKSMLIPYMHFTLKQNSFDSITLSPTPNAELAKKSLEMLLENKKIEHCLICNSLAPFRNY